MISSSILNFVTLLINKVVVFAGLDDFVISENIGFMTIFVKDAIRRGVPMLSWIFPNEDIYRLCVGLTVDLFTATLIFEIIALWLRIYKTVRR